MKVILLEEVKGRGGEGDVINVKDGFANNYLLTQGKAVKATPGALKQLEERRQNIAKREEVRVAEAKEIKEKLDGIKFKADVQIGEELQLFGAVTSQMIADGIKEKTGVEIDKRRIDIRRAIKTVGLHDAEVVIYRDIKSTVHVIVGAESTEAYLEQIEAKNPGKKGKAKKKNKEDKATDTEGSAKAEEASDKAEEPKEEKAEAPQAAEEKTEE